MADTPSPIGRPYRPTRFDDPTDVEDALKFIKSDITNRLTNIVGQITAEDQLALKDSAMLAALISLPTTLKDLQCFDKIEQLVRVAFLEDPFPINTDLLFEKLCDVIKRHQGSLPSSISKEAKMFIKESFREYRKSVREKVKHLHQKRTLGKMTVNNFANNIFSRILFKVENRLSIKQQYLANAVAMRFMVLATDTEHLKAMFPKEKRKIGIFWTVWKNNRKAKIIKPDDAAWVAYKIKKDEKYVKNYEKNCQAL